MMAGRRLGVRLCFILCVSVLVLLVQMITVSRLSTPSQYPWEVEEQRNSRSRNAEEGMRVRNPLEAVDSVCYSIMCIHCLGKVLVL